jgi:hypothetical protein
MSSLCPIVANILSKYSQNHDLEHIPDGLIHAAFFVDQKMLSLESAMKRLNLTNYKWARGLEFDFSNIPGDFKTQFLYCVNRWKNLYNK